MNVRLSKFFPPEILEQQILLPGGAFRTRHQFGPGTPKYRYFFILNKDPKTDNSLIIATATTKIEKHLTKHPKRAVVIISPSEYPELEKTSAIDCDSARERTHSELKNTIRQDDFLLLSPLPSDVIERIRSAVAESKIMTQKMKRAILGNI